MILLMVARDCIFFIFLFLRYSVFSFIFECFFFFFFEVLQLLFFKDCAKCIAVMQPTLFLIFVPDICQTQEWHQLSAAGETIERSDSSR